ncbi:MAG: hypothetical protein IPI49_14520 [Myxococcales bacterium]|nr:hypothetical protein [Myxococcales bacterium]
MTPLITSRPVPPVEAERARTTRRGVRKKLLEKLTEALPLPPELSSKAISASKGSRTWITGSAPGDSPVVRTL